MYKDIAWLLSSILLGLGFTFFSGATEAWLVDALESVGNKKSLESIFAKAQVVGGMAMLGGSVSGGMIAQTTNLSVPYIIRAIILGITFVIAFKYMKDWGFTPVKTVSIVNDMKKLLVGSFVYSWKLPALRWVMLSAPVITGVGFFAFYSMQPYLLELYGDKTAYAIAGLAAAIVAGSQIVGGILSPHLNKIFKLRTSILILGVAVSSASLFLIGLSSQFLLALVLLIVWGLVSAAIMPARQAYLNSLIDSKQRATMLSFNALLGSSGGIVIQPALGRVADLSGYGLSFVVGAVIQSTALPFLLLARKVKSKADQM